jgi:hypothetical protein
MISVKNDLADRKAETENLIKFIFFLENNSPMTTGIDVLRLNTSIKANTVLMLYNAVEATVTSCLNKVHAVINLEHIKFNELTNEMKKLFAMYYGSSIDKAGTLSNEMDYVLLFVDLLQSEQCINITYKELSNNYQLYSGNLDSKEIKSVLSKYGIDFQEACSELQTIKKDRNILAHGEQSFEELGRRLSKEQLQVMCNKTFVYLEQMIDEISDYLAEKRYKVIED